MSSKSFVSSAVLHGLVLTLMALDLSFATMDEHKAPPAILMVDLTKVQISDKTNLPPKVQQKPKKAVKPQPKKPAVVEKARPTQVKAPAPEPPKPKPAAPVKDAAPIVEPKKPVETKKESKSKTEKKTATPPKKEEPKKQTYDMKSLLASVEKVRKQAPTPITPEEVPEEARQTDGIEGGTEGSLTQVLTISERDLIANQLKKCWNVDAGAEGIDDIIVEIRAFINKDGSVREVKILNKLPHRSFLPIAESAQRAVWLCDKSDHSPFLILAEKYSEHYSDWKELYLRFNPIDGGIF